MNWKRGMAVRGGNTAAAVEVRPRPTAGLRAGIQRASVLIVMIALGAAMAHAQSPPASPATTSSSSVVNRSAAGSASGNVTVILSAILADDGPPIDQGVIWHVFRDQPTAEGKRLLLSVSKDAAPHLKLDPGEYIVNAAYGRAMLTRKIAVEAGKPLTEVFNLNAGGLRIEAALAGGELLPDRQVVFDVLSQERDQSGNRIKIVSGARTGLIIRLNAGSYQVVSTYGDANARVRADVTVEAGKRTDATLVQTGAKVTFKLVAQQGGEAFADVAWSIIDTKAAIVKEAVGALPTHILAAGRYAVLAKRGSRTFRAEFTAKAGEAAVVEVVAR